LNGIFIIMRKKYAYLLKKKFVTDKDLRKALSISQRTDTSVETTLINHFLIPKSFIGKSLSIYHNCEFIAYDPEMPIATEVFKDLHLSLLLKDCWFPLSWDENGIIVLVNDPSNPGKREIIKEALQTKKIIYAVGIKEDIETFINQSVEPLEICDLVSAAEAGERPIDVKKIVDIMFSEAYKKGASAIHFESSEIPENSRVLFSIDGEYLEYMTVPGDVANDIVKRIKSMANLDAEDARLSKIGHIKFQRDGLPEFRITVTTFPNEGLREVVDLRILNVGNPSNHGVFQGER